jgi:hypothetical protein
VMRKGANRKHARGRPAQTTAVGHLRPYAESSAIRLQSGDCGHLTPIGETTEGNPTWVITRARVSFWPLSSSPPNLERVMNLRQV